MTVKELKAQLEKYPPNIHVVVNGYEGGWDDINPESISKKEVLLNFSKESYYGKHEELFFVQKKILKKEKQLKFWRLLDHLIKLEISD